MVDPEPRVLFLAPVAPWARENGSSVVIADLLEGLAVTRQCPILPVFLRPSPAAAAPNGPPGLDSVTLGVPSLPKAVSLVLALSTGTSPWETRLRNRRIARLAASIAREKKFIPTLIHVEHLPLLKIGWHLAREFRCPLVYRSHNIESVLWKRRLAKLGPLLRGVFRRIERQEVRAIRESRLTLCISDVDFSWARSRAPDARIDILPAALFLARYERFLSHPVADQQICFVGGLDWGPNERGLRWFVDEVLPLIQKRVPGVRLAILARGASDRSWITGNSAIAIVPPAHDAPSLFASSRVSIAPLLEGGGVRIKILESLGVGCPVVATRIGGEGIELPGLTNTDVPSAFAHACIGHLERAPDARMRRELHESVHAQSGAEHVARKLFGFWSGVLQR